jgi:hypothetical protein
MELILQHDAAGVNDHANFGVTPLHIALLMNIYEAAKFLLLHGADPTIEDHDEKTPLHCLLGPRALDRTLEKILKDFTGDTYIPALASVAAKDGTAATFLRVWRTYKPDNAAKLFEDALSNRNESVAIAMVKKGLFPDLDAFVPDIEAPLVVASVLYGQDSVAKLLVEQGASDICDSQGQNAVQAATLTNNRKLLSFFLAQGFSATSTKGNAIQCAINMHHPSCLRVLLAHGEPVRGHDMTMCLSDSLALLVAAGVPRSDLKDQGMIEAYDDEMCAFENCVHLFPTLQDLCRVALCVFVDQQRSNLFFFVKKMNLSSGLAKLVLLGESLS